jgi:hypothetical protein
MTRFRPFDVIDWYWIVAGSTTQVYASARGQYVPVSDTTYQSWLLAAGNPTKVDTEGSLGPVLGPYWATTPPSTVLAVAQAQKQARLDQILNDHVDIGGLVRDGTVTTITGTQVSNFLASGTNNYRSLRAQIAAATTAAQANAIDVTAGWPANP